MTDPVSDASRQVRFRTEEQTHRTERLVRSVEALGGHYIITPQYLPTSAESKLNFRLAGASLLGEPLCQR
ncbi:hypothetical protein R5W23_006004, partial [Gemmata sp. JC673]